MGLFDFLKKKPQIPPEALTLWVHRLSHFEVLRELRVREGAEPMRVAPLNEVFGAVAALATTDGPVGLTAKHLQALDMTMQQALQRATGNMQAGISQMGVAQGLCLWESPQAPALAIFAPAAAKHAALKGRPVVMVPTDGFALMAGDEDDEALANMLELATAAYAKSPEYRSLRAVAWLNGDQSTEWLPPQGHPLRAKFKAAAAETKHLEATSVHEALFGDRAPLTPLAKMPAAHGGHLKAAWFRGADLLLTSHVDTVVLIDTDDAPLPRLEVDLETLLDSLPHAFDPLTSLDGEGEAPRLLSPVYRARGLCFPTPHERAFLKARLEARTATPEEREVSGTELLAEWDRGVPMLAEAAPGGDVALIAPDNRTGTVSLADFGPRMERLSAQDESMFYTSFFSAALLAQMQGVDDVALTQVAEGLVAKREAAGERLARERPSVVPSRPGPEGVAHDSVEAFMHRLLEPGRLFPIVRPPGYAEASHENLLGQLAGSRPGVDVAPSTHVSKPFAEQCTLELVSDFGDRVMTLNAELVNAPTLVDAAWRSALLNLAAASQQPLAATAAPGVYSGPWHDEYGCG